MKQEYLYLAARVKDLWSPPPGFGKRIRKGDKDIVTYADLYLESGIREVLAEISPGIPVLGEEISPDTPERGAFWTVDGLDGTWSYAAGLPAFGTQIALCADARPVFSLLYLPLSGTMCLAEKGGGAQINGAPAPKARPVPPEKGICAFSTLLDSRLAERARIMEEAVRLCGRVQISGSACFDWIMLAKGAYSAKIALFAKRWDTAPGLLLAEETGHHVVETPLGVFAASDKDGAQTLAEAAVKAAGEDR